MNDVGDDNTLKACFGSGTTHTHTHTHTASSHKISAFFYLLVYFFSLFVFFLGGGVVGNDMQLVGS